MQSLTLKVKGKLNEGILRELSREINPAFLREQLELAGVPNEHCSKCCTNTFECTEPYDTIPTRDLTLQVLGNDFYGPASGCQMRSKLLVKAVALRAIQYFLEERGIGSEMTFEDVAREEYEMLSKYGLAPKERAPAWLA